MRSAGCCSTNSKGRCPLWGGSGRGRREDGRLRGQPRGKGGRESKGASAPRKTRAAKGAVKSTANPSGTAEAAAEDMPGDLGPQLRMRQ